MYDKFVLFGLYAIITDYKFYADNEKEIDSWLHSHNCSREGMVVQFIDEQTKTMFLLRWA
jgi:hypothetical protein